jgi:Fic family protein
MKEYKIEELKDFLNKKRPLSETALKKIYENLKTDYVYNSNAIEGNTLTLKETQIVLEYGITVKGKSLNEHIEAKNQAFALDYLVEEVKNKREIDKRVIKEFHQIVIGDINRNIAGKFRVEPVTIGGSETKTVNAFHIEEELDKLLKWYNNEKEMNIIDKVAVFHSKFEKIHPFLDGNGRTGRLLMNLELMKEGYPITIIKNEDRLDYYSALEKSQTTDDYTDIKNFIRENVKRGIINFLEAIENDWKSEIEKFLIEKNKKIIRKTKEKEELEL